MFLTSLSSIQKCSVTRVHLTSSPLQGAALKGASRSPDSSGSLAIAALTTLLPPIGVFFALVLSFAALSIVGGWAVDAALLQKPLMYPPAVLQTGVVISSSQPPVADVLVAHSSRSFDRWLLSHWRFFEALSPVPWPVVLDVLALHWRSRPSR